MRRATLFMALLAGLVLSACGQYSFIVVKLSQGTVDYTTRQQVVSCAARLSGAVSDSFNIECGSLDGKFEYSTTKDSGEVTVVIEGLGSNGEVIISGTQKATLVSGGSVEVTVTLEKKI